MEEKKLNPLQRVFVPIEKRGTDGHMRLRTLDGAQYIRDGVTGSLHRIGKVNGKQAKRARHKCRQS